MQCHLVYLTGSLAGEARSFNAARITVGRSSTCDFQFDPYNDLAVAAQHAEILLDEDTFFVHDLNTRGGTWVNGERIDERHPLRHEDYLQFGKNGPEVIFRKGKAAPGKQLVPPPPPETGELEFLSGADAGKIFPIIPGRATRVGRRSDVEISLDPRGDMVVSGNHCTISLEQNGFSLLDSSRNGTFINGVPVRGTSPLRDGDILTLGEGGPRARFLIHPPRRIYPNLSGEYPQVREVSRDRVPPEVLQRRETEAREADHRAAEAALAAADLDRGQDEPQGDSLGASPEVSVPLQPSPSFEAAVPLSRNIAARFREYLLTMSARRWLILGIAAASLFVLIAILIMALPRGKASGAPVQEDYARELRSGTSQRCNTGQYTIQAPKGWSTRENGAYLSIESGDKRVNVDYVRDARLSSEKVREILAQEGATVKAQPTSKSGNVTLVPFTASSQKTMVYAVLHSPVGDVPAMALLEAPPDAYKKLSRDTVNALTVDNLKLQQIASAGKPTPPTPPDKTSIPKSPSTTPTASLMPAQATRATSATATPPSATPSATKPPTSATLAKLANPSLGLAFTPPEGWDGLVDKETGITTLRSPDGVTVRVARDRERLTASDVFGAMSSDGWTIANENANKPIGARRFSVAEMERGKSRLLLLLMDQPNGTTLMLYATRAGDFTPEQRAAIADIVKQMSAQ